MVLKAVSSVRTTERVILAKANLHFHPHMFIALHRFGTLNDYLIV
jgi:hypothetical protein